MKFIIFTLILIQCIKSKNVLLELENDDQVSGSDYQSEIDCMPGYPCNKDQTPCMPGYPCNEGKAKTIFVKLALLPIFLKDIVHIRFRILVNWNKKGRMANQGWD